MRNHHQPAPVEAVGKDPGEGSEQHVGRDVHGVQQSSQQRGSRPLEHQDGHHHEADGGASCAYRVGGPVAAERRIVTESPLCGGPAGPRRVLSGPMPRLPPHCDVLAVAGSIAERFRNLLATISRKAQPASHELRDL